MRGGWAPSGLAAAIRCTWIALIDSVVMFPPHSASSSGGALEEKELVRLDDRRRQVLRREELVSRDPERLGER